MPRKTKIEELRAWVLGYNTYIIRVELEHYNTEISVLAKNQPDAHAAARKEYPDCKNVRCINSFKSILI
jgi:hypothetical protein